LKKILLAAFFVTAVATPDWAIDSGGPPDETHRSQPAEWLRWRGDRQRRWAKWHYLTFTIFICNVAIYEFLSMSGFRINMLIAFWFCDQHLSVYTFCCDCHCECCIIFKWA